MFIDFKERGKGRGNIYREREIEKLDVREKHLLVVSQMYHNRESNPKPMCVH